MRSPTMGRALPSLSHTADFSRRTFDEMLRRATVVLRAGRGVILDATFRAAATCDGGPRSSPASMSGHSCSWRRRASDDTILRERLRRRATRPSVSDATEPLLARMRAAFEPVTELEPGQHVVVRTTEPVVTLVETVRRRLAR